MNNPLFEIREVGLDIVGAIHIRKYLLQNKEWDCKCPACEYVRTEPRLVEVMLKKTKEDIDKDRAKNN